MSRLWKKSEARDFEIDTRNQRLAVKMVQTILDRRGVPAAIQDELFTACTIVSLEHLLVNHLEWIKPLPFSVRLRLAEGRPSFTESTGGIAIGSTQAEEQVEAAAEKAEQIMEDLQLEELERASLYTALPCLGTLALRPFLRWKVQPPFFPK